MLCMLYTKSLCEVIEIYTEKFVVIGNQNVLVTTMTAFSYALINSKGDKWKISDYLRMLFKLYSNHKIHLRSFSFRLEPAFSLHLCGERKGSVSGIH